MTKSIKQALTAKEYSKWYKKTKVNFHNFQHVIAIKELSESGESVPNLSIAKKLGMTPAGVGQICTRMESTGVIKNVSTHPLYKDWRLTEIGEEFADALLKGMN